MKIGMYAYDVGPISMFRAIKNQSTVEIVICGGAPTEDVVDRLFGTDIVLLGLSAFGSAAEAYVAGILASRGIPSVFIEDRPGHATHKALKPLVSIPRALIVPMKDSVDEAIHFGYKHVEYLGAPAHWIESLGVFTDVTNYRSRMCKAKGGRKIELSDADTVLIIGGFKDSAMTTVTLQKVIAEAGRVISEENMVVCFRPHPSESPVSQGVSIRESLDKEVWSLEYSALDHIRSDPEKKHLMMPMLVKVADIAFFSGGATDSIVASLARKPGIYLTSRDIRARNTEQGIKDGRWFVTEMGGLLEADMDVPGAITEAVTILMTEEGKKSLKTSQERWFPIPDHRDTANNIIKFLKGLSD